MHVRMAAGYCNCKGFQFCPKGKYPDGKKRCRHITGVQDGSIDPMSITRAPPAAKSTGQPTGKKSAGKKSAGKTGAGKKRAKEADEEDEEDEEAVEGEAESAGGFDFHSLNKKQLALLLGDNDQHKSGSKGELVELAAERHANGALLRCSACGGGRFKKVSATRWQCPGCVVCARTHTHLLRLPRALCPSTCSLFTRTVR